MWFSLRNGDIQPNKEITAAIRVDNPLDRHSTRNKRSCGSIVQVFVRMFQVDGVIGKIIIGKIIDGKII